MAQSRQLAAIMFTDIVGYTALMGDDEQKAFDLLRKNRQIQKPLIEKFHGKWIKELGDGVLASFPAVTDAVAAACSIIKACDAIPDLKLRIGIHLGEVVVEDDDVFGDGVNIASRLQALAPIGGVWISEAVQNNIANKKGLVTKFVKAESLKHVKEPVRIYEVDSASFEPDLFQPSQETKTVEQKSEPILKNKDTTRKRNEVERLSRVKSRRNLVYWGLPLMGLLMYVALSAPTWINKRRAKNEIIPEIQRLSFNAGVFVPTKLFQLAKEAEQYIPDDSALIKIWPDISMPMNIETEPSGAGVYWKEYNDSTDHWNLAGTTPFLKAWLPRSFIKIKIEKPGFHPIEDPGVPFWGKSMRFKLDSIDKFPSTMSRVYADTSGLLLVGLEKNPSLYVPTFLADKFETTNEEYKKFVEAGGYSNQKYWDQPILKDGKELRWEDAMKLFVDKTGKPGPSTWELSSYPEGKEKYPVAGVSWYEAMAYAKFAGKAIPSLYQWACLANTWNTWGIIPNSNFGGTGTMPVGKMRGTGNWGAHDIAGNAREWCYNRAASNERYIMGGGYNDQTYAYNDAYSQDGLDRSPSNGFRCIKFLKPEDDVEYLKVAIDRDFRDYNKEKPVDDKSFAFFQRQYNYDHTPFNATSQILFDSGFLKVEKVVLDATYNHERFSIYLYIPKNAKPPYQPIVFYPGSGVLYSKEFNFRSEMWVLFDFMVRNGRLIAYPVLKSCFDRHDERKSDLQDETIDYKQHVISWVQDYRRTIDYLSSRKDIRADQIGYYSLSWGSAMAPLVCANEPRIKAAVLHVGGLMMEKTLPEVDPLNFLPRMKCPTLMLNGKNDTFFPIETSQKPMFSLLGSPTADKKMISYEGGHVVPQIELMRESTSWFDKYLGPVK